MRRRDVVRTPKTTRPVSAVEKTSPAAKAAV